MLKMFYMVKYVFVRVALALTAEIALKTKKQQRSGRSNNGINHRVIMREIIDIIGI